MLSSKMFRFYECDLISLEALNFECFPIDSCINLRLLYIKLDYQHVFRQLKALNDVRGGLKILYN